MSEIPWMSASWSRLPPIGPHPTVDMIVRWPSRYSEKKNSAVLHAAGILSQAANSKIGKAREEQGIEACDDLWINDGCKITLDPSLEFRVHL